MSWPAKIREFVFAPSDGRPLAALRIVLGLSLLYEAGAVLPFLDDLYGQYGFLQAHLIEALTGAAVPGWFSRLGLGAEAHAAAIRVFFTIHALGAVALLLGFQFRAAAVTVWLTQTIWINSGYLSSYGVDRYFHILNFMMVFLPAANVWSLDRWWSGEPARDRSDCTTGLRLVQLFLLMTYLNAGLAKTVGIDWRSGDAVWEVINMPWFKVFDLYWLAHYPWIIQGLTWGTLVVEIFYCVGVWLPFVGRAWVLSIIGMHLGIATLMGLQLFGVSLAMMNAAIFLVPIRKLDYANPESRVAIGNPMPANQMAV